MSGTYQKMKQRDQDQSAQSKADFVASLSHEIRTPMNAVLGFCHLLEQKQLTEEERGLVIRIRAAGDTLLSIITDMLDFSKIETGRIQLESVRFRLGEVYDRVICRAFASLIDKPVNFELTPLPTNIEFLVGDPARLEQVLNQLIRNAIKFTQQGKIQLIVSLEEIATDKVRLRFIVRDTGIGIAPDKIPEVFSPFAQFEESITGKFGGAGLGLSISQRLVQMMGGEIGVNSQLGVGSEFWFALPYARVLPSFPEHSALATHRVLIAEESRLIRDELLAMVKGFGWLETVAETGQKALDCFNSALGTEAPFDTVIMDWRMRGKEGLPLLPVLRALGGEKLILVATAHDSEGLTEIADVADAVMSKFANASTLFNTVMNLSSKRDGGLSKLGLHLGSAVGNRLQGIRILVADDNEINLEVAHLNLQAEGAQVSLAVDGQDAVNWLRENPSAVDVVLMDVQMPVLDGFDATRQIRQTLGMKDLPIIALTAGVFKNEQEAAKACGMDGFIPKPFNMDTVVETIQSLTGHQHQQNNTEAEFQRIITEPLLMDVERGIHTWMNEANYVKYLGYFLETYAGLAEEFTRLIENNDVLGAVSLAHKLHGTAANLALPKLSGLAEQAELKLGKGLEISEMIPQIQTTLGETLAAVRRYTQRFDAPSEVPASSAELNGLVKLINDLMVALDMDKPEGSEKLLGRLAETLAPSALHEIRKAVDAFDLAQEELLNIALAHNSRMETKR